MDKTVLERIKRIEERLDALELAVKTMEASPARKASPTLIKEFLTLPSSLQKTLLAVQELGEAMATEVAEKTGRVRSVETIYLNQLTRLGYLTRIRKSRRVYFKVLRYY